MDEQQIRADEREIIFDLVLIEKRVIDEKLAEIEAFLSSPETLSMEQLTALEGPRNVSIAN